MLLSVADWLALEMLLLEDNELAYYALGIMICFIPNLRLRRNGKLAFSENGFDFDCVCD